MNTIGTATMAVSKSHVCGECRPERAARGGGGSNTEQAERRVRSATPTASTKECNYASVAHSAIVLILGPKYIFVASMKK